MSAPGLTAARCRLRAYRSTDATDLTREASDLRIARYMSLRFPHPYTRADADAWLAGAVLSPTDWAIEVDGRYAGGIGFHPEAQPGIRELGYWIAVGAWGRGIATEAVALVVAHAFAHLAVRRIEAHVFAENGASARVLEKNHFTCEGVLREYYVHRDGSLGDALFYARLARDGASPAGQPPTAGAADALLREDDHACG